MVCLWNGCKGCVPMEGICTHVMGVYGCVPREGRVCTYGRSEGKSTYGKKG